MESTHFCMECDEVFPESQMSKTVDGVWLCADDYAELCRQAFPDLTDEESYEHN